MGYYDVDGGVVTELREKFAQEFGSASWREYLYVRAPGRTEIAGNHTDHEGGSVIAAAVERYIVGIFSPNEKDVIRLMSEGYDLIELPQRDFAPRADEHNTSVSLIRGLAALFAERGFAPKGFDAYIKSTVPKGSGLSSSAAFELELAQGMNVLWAKGVVAPDELAIMSQRAEREWFGKPCGLMDQAASALGSIEHMSFAVPGAIDAECIDFDFAKAGYRICLVAVGSDHAALTSEYAAVPGEMQAVAKELGKDLLGELDERDVIAALPQLRAKLGDRPVLRALHYYREERLVAERADALKAGDMPRFLELTRQSGASSAMYLQNVSVHGAEGQPSMVALALAEELAGERAAVRIHGGGFGGTIQAFLPEAQVDVFVAGMEAALGKDSCMVCSVDHDGARSWRL